MLIVLAAAIVLAQASPPSPTPSTPAPAKAAEAAVPAKPEKPKQVCYDERAIGSIISTRVCRTVKQTDADRQQAQRENDALADHLAACHGASC
jgi:hypothetical protein